MSIVEITFTTPSRRERAESAIQEAKVFINVYRSKLGRND